MLSWSSWKKSLISLIFLAKARSPFPSFKMNDLRQFFTFIILKESIPYKKFVYFEEFVMIIDRINWAFYNNHRFIYKQYRVFAWLILLKMFKHLYLYIIDGDAISYYVSVELLNKLHLDRKINLFISALLWLTFYFFNEIYSDKNRYAHDLFRSGLIHQDKHLFYWPYTYKDQDVFVFLRRAVLTAINLLQAFIVCISMYPFYCFTLNTILANLFSLTIMELL